MSKPSDTPLSILPRVLEEVTKFCLDEAPHEACGFIVGHNGVGQRILRVDNVQPYVSDKENVTNAYQMSNDDILAVMGMIDETGEDLVAVYHSHPKSEPIPSQRDTQVRDVDPAYLIISLADGQPRARAWRFDVEYIGERRTTEVLLYLSENGKPYSEEQNSPVPWALSTGNRVEITYTRPNNSVRRKVRATITGNRVEMEDVVTIELKGEEELDPKSILLSRIQSVRVLKESAEARRTRSKLQALARWCAQMMSEGKFSEIGSVIEILAAAYPKSLIHVDKKGD